MAPAKITRGSNEEVYAFPMSLAQQRFWLADQMMPGNPSMNMPITLRLSGSLDKVRLKGCFEELIARHEVLRTTFGLVDGEPMQLVHSAIDLVFDETDLSDLPEHDRQAQADRLVREEVCRPFSLSTGPLVRVTVLSLTVDEYLLLINLPHIICDGWSNGILVRELTSLYDASSADRPAPFAELAIEYADYSVWQRDWLKSAALNEDLAYWKEHLQGRLPILDLPTDRPVQPGIVSRGETATMSINPEFVAFLKEFSRREEATLFMFFLAVFKTMLFRYTGQEDILVGAPVAGRTLETDNVVGPFASSIALRTNLAGALTFRELLGRIRDVTLGALAHTALPFERLLDELDAKQLRGRNPLFQIYFLHQVAFLQPIEAGGVTWTPQSWASPGTTFDLYLAMLERPDGTAVRLEYKADEFDPSTVREMLEDFHAIAEAVSRDPTLRLIDIPLASPLARRVRPPVRAGTSDNQTDSDIARSSSQTATPDGQAFAASQVAGSSAGSAAEGRRQATSLAEARENDRSEAGLVPDPGISRIQALLLPIWEETLDKSPIAPDDDFLELGGNSILATRLMTRVNEVLGQTLPLAFLFGFPSPAKLAAGICAQLKTKSNPRFIALQPFGDQAPLFLVGAATKLVELLRGAKWGHPILSLLSSQETGSTAAYTLQEEAAGHVETILEVQKNGPYLLGGFSAGGIVAYEIARQLTARGKIVAILVLFDVSNPVFMHDYSRLSRFWIGLRYSVRYHRMNLRNISKAAVPGYFAQKAKGWRAQPLAPTEPSVILMRIEAARKYRPKPLSNPVLLFKRSSKQFLGRHADPLFGWGSVIKGDLDVSVFDCAEHLDIFVGENGEILSRKLRNRLREALQEVALRRAPRSSPEDYSVPENSPVTMAATFD